MPKSKKVPKKKVKFIDPKTLVENFQQDVKNHAYNSIVAIADPISKYSCVAAGCDDFHLLFLTAKIIEGLAAESKRSPKEFLDIVAQCIDNDIQNSTTQENTIAI